MVKGVNRQRIEINDTGNRHFERVLLFVSAGSSDLTDSQLQAKAEEYLRKISPEFKNTPTLREHCKRKNGRKRLLIALGSVLLAVAAAVVVFNIL